MTEELRYGAKIPKNIRSWSIDNFLEKEEFEKIKEYFYNHPKLENKNISYYGARMISSYNDEYLKEIHQKMLPVAKELFQEDNMIPSYAIFSDYRNLGHVLNHKDEGPCWFTIDLCLYANTDWPIYIDDVEYVPQENQAVMMYSSHQFHYKPQVKDPSNRNGILLLHYCPPEHYFFNLPLDLQKQYVPSDDTQYLFTLIDELKDIRKAIDNQ